MTSSKKLVSSLDSLAQTYSDRREGDRAILHDRAGEIPAIVASYLASLDTNQRIEGAESDAIRVLLGGGRVDSYLASVEDFNALTAIRAREAARGGDTVAREAEPAPKEIRVESGAINGIPGYPATKRTKATAPASTSPSTASPAPEAPKTQAGIVDLRSAPASWNFYTARKAVEVAAKSHPNFGAKKIERTLLALAGATSHKAVVEVAAKAGLLVLREGDE